MQLCVARHPWILPEGISAGQRLTPKRQQWLSVRMDSLHDSAPRKVNGRSLSPVDATSARKSSSDISQRYVIYGKLSFELLADVIPLPYVLQHGFTKDNLRELLFALLQLLQQNEEPSLVHMIITDSILEQFAEQVEAGKIVVDTEVHNYLYFCTDDNTTKITYIHTVHVRHIFVIADFYSAAENR